MKIKLDLAAAIKTGPEPDCMIKINRIFIAFTQEYEENMIKDPNSCF